MTTPTFPMSAIVGQDDLRRALMLCLIDPGLGGLLVRGQRGTAKSTAVRALAALLPDQEVSEGCPYGIGSGEPCPCAEHGPARTRRAPLVELPLGAAAERVIGQLDLGRALTDGVAAFEPGLLAAAHRGVLYVDEVNLLPDALVDVLLDVAASGVNVVERDGHSVRHAARFLLVGTMNPEEGELRPQLVDRFGLSVEVAAPQAAQERVEVVRRRLAFDRDPAGFAERYAAEEDALAQGLAAARGRLAGVRLSDRRLLRISALCASLGVDGLRADLACARAAVALAALEGADEVGDGHVEAAASLALPHRLRQDPLAPPPSAEEIRDALRDGPEDGDEPAGGRAPETPEDDDEPASEPAPGTPEDDDEPPSGPAPSASDGCGETIGPADGPRSDGSGTPAGMRAMQDVQPPERRSAPVLPLPARVPATDDSHAGRRARANGCGPAVAAVAEGGRDVAVVATLVAAATDRARGTAVVVGPAHLGPAVGRARPRGVAVEPHDVGPAVDQRRPLGPVVVEPRHLRHAVRQGRRGALVVFCVDASGSMGARRRMSAVKGAVMALLTDAYQRRDRIALVTFRGEAAQVALEATSSTDRAAQALRRLPTGGRTPLAHGLDLAGRVVARERLREPGRLPMVVLVTDGRGTHGPDPMPVARGLSRHGAHLVVVDCERGPVRVGAAARLAAAAGGEVVALDDRRAGAGLDLAAHVRDLARQLTTTRRAA